MSGRAERTRSLGSLVVTVIRYPCRADRTGLLGSLLGIPSLRSAFLVVTVIISRWVSPVNKRVAVASPYFFFKLGPMLGRDGRFCSTPTHMLNIFYAMKRLCIGPKA